MFDFQFLGKSLIGFGLIITLIGVLVFFSDKIPYLGRLPGDIFIKKENFSFYFPITTGLLLSLIISLILWLFKK